MSSDTAQSKKHCKDVDPLTFSQSSLFVLLLFVLWNVWRMCFNLRTYDLLQCSFKKETELLAELFWELKTCNTDHDCWPRICCPDGLNKYCRTSRPELDSLPVGKQLAYRECADFYCSHVHIWPFKNDELKIGPFPLIHIQQSICCPAICSAHQHHRLSMICIQNHATILWIAFRMYVVFWFLLSSVSIECFQLLSIYTQKVCCQEAGKKYCRPPKKSIFVFLTTFARVSESRQKLIYL